MNDNKNNELKNAKNALVFSTIIILCLVFYICYDKGIISINLNPEKNQETNQPNIIENNKEEKKEDEEVDKIVTTDLSLTDTTVKELSNIFFQKFLQDETSLYANHFYRNDKTILADEPLELKLEVAAKSIEANGSNSISGNKMKSTYEKIFGVGTYKASNFWIYTYHADQDKYVIEVESGGTTCEHTDSKLIKAVKEEDSKSSKIIITEAFVYQECDASTGETKYNYYKGLNEQGYVLTSNEQISPLDTDYEKFSQYAYTFVKDNSGNYIFTSVEKVK